MTTQNEVRSTTVTRELVEGVSGNGNAVYMVVTICQKTQRWLHTEKFKIKAEAECWLKYA